MAAVEAEKSKQGNDSQNAATLGPGNPGATAFSESW
ncbi:hypothetical protein CYA_0101 [Synechococcus sp. JA-3-3Ab]|nr:hypothetical protein CYA_0101 [Synechococcus sp. JA-3-3Ab]